MLTTIDDRCYIIGQLQRRIGIIPLSNRIVEAVIQMPVNVLAEHLFIPNLDLVFFTVFFLLQLILGFLIRSPSEFDCIIAVNRRQFLLSLLIIIRLIIRLFPFRRGSDALDLSRQIYTR